MSRINSILAIVDPTAEVHPAVAKAAVLAEKLGARLDLFACETKASRQARMAAHARKHTTEPFVVNVTSLLELLAQPLRDRGIDVTTETEFADPLYMALIDRTRQTSADLVIKDTHHHSLAKRTFLTNTDWHLIRCCPVPLLLTKQTTWASHPKIVAAVDPGHVNDKPYMLDHRILEHASVLARRLDGELHTVHAFLPLAIAVAATTSVPPMAASVSAEELKVEEAAKRQEVAKLVTQYGIDQANIHVELGGPGELLPRMAGLLHADIMTMGAIARSGLKRAFIGSTAEDVLERLPCDALIVKPLNFADLLPF
jgi:universal stress protein E